jgi:hypothetical protein
VQSNPRVYSVVWLAVGGIMATMYVINGIQASSIPYLVIASGWALFGAAQSWRWHLVAASSGASESARSRNRFSPYVTVVAFVLIVGGVAAGWWA